MRPTIVRVVVLALSSALVCTVAAGFVDVGTLDVAAGQDRGSRARAERGPTKAREAEPDAPETSADDVSAESSERAEGGGRVKVFRFSGLDVSGRLKAPQLLYFLNRLRAEFDRPRLPHRSFARELERSTHGKSF